MVSIPKPGTLKVVCDPLPQSPRNGHTTPKLSPSSFHDWQHSLEDLSKELQKICHSPATPPASPCVSRNSPDMIAVPIMLSPKSDPGNSQHNRSTESPGLQFPVPTLLVNNVSADHTVLRVRHEETKDLLQKRLSQISGFKNGLDRSFGQPRDRKASKEMAMMVNNKLKQQEHSNTSRFRHVINIGNCSHDKIKTVCDNYELKVYEVNENQADIELHSIQIPENLDLEKLICTVMGENLELTEYPKKTIFTEQSLVFRNDKSKNGVYNCITVEEIPERNSWKLVWHIPCEFEAQHVTVKTEDEKLIVVCKKRSLSKSEKHFSSDPITSPGSGAYYKVMIELPEDVEPKTVSAVVTKSRQLIIQALSSWRSRCFTY